jgi:prephenate dehydrogenase
VISGKRIAVVGLGLMGGSLARALSSRGARVLGFDRQTDYLDAAMREGVVHEEIGPAFDEIATAEIIVLAVPGNVTRDLLVRLTPKMGSARLVMDIASTKRRIVTAAEQAGIGRFFVGAHPLTGSHRSGWGASRVSLFEEARIFLCPTEQTSPEALRLAQSFWRSLRAGVEVLDAATHDVQMGWRSHLPHMLAIALAVTLRDAGVRRSMLGPGGRDMTRLAGSSPVMWTGIAEENAAAIHEALLAFEDHSRIIRDALAKGDVEGVTRLLGVARDWFDGDPTEPLTRRGTPS